MLDISDISMDLSHSSSGSAGRRRRRAASFCVVRDRRRVRFSVIPDGPVAVEIQHFANPEFTSPKLQDRKEIWYSSMEIRALKQLNMDLCRQKQEREESQEEDDSVCWRGLEHLVEGETKRRQRIQHFLAAILKVQTERKRKGAIRPEAMADALQSFSRSQSRGDRRRALKVGKLDYAAAQEGDSSNSNNSNNNNSNNNTQGKSRSFLLRSSSARKLLGRRCRRRSVHDTPGSGPTVQRNLSLDTDQFQKRRTLLRRVSHRAAAMLPNRRSSTLSATSATSSTRSLQSTGSTASATSSSRAIGAEETAS
ncbi:expressed unknown protein [Seminavis robusta]|uniref:Uncharacterized protein n=1 Tax=Seminavis robusta TaxID=568900 RepID=A0A9N8E6A6_9STRA|nr:expressed unknown protein [Seminavis robusta]|eukprot:Sro588_g171590.1 n/a (309) ;mRNA; f:53763-54689